MSPQIITDEKGKKVGVFLPYKDFEKIMKDLENTADEEAYERSMKSKEETVPAREAFKLIEEKRKKSKIVK